MAELDSQPKSIQSLYAWYAEGQLWVNRRYQRKLVWTLEEKQKLVESAMKKYPIPAVLLAEREEGGYEVIDGLQRIHTLVSFIEMGFPTSDERYFAVSEFPTANTRAGEALFTVTKDVPLLSAKEVGTLLDYSLAVSVMRGATNAEVDDVFARINTYGHRLSDQERRQAGVQNEFSRSVRQISAGLRGDASGDILALSEMPTISIDLPKAKHGYEVSAKEVFWVEHGILRATDLRDSMDEQCVADIAASVMGGLLIPRSKDALDLVYQDGADESVRINDAIATYGADKMSAEFKFIVDEIRSVVGGLNGGGKLRDLLFAHRTTNPFPALFTVLFIAFHELLITGGKKFSDYGLAHDALNNLSQRVDTSRGSTSAAERRQNINTIKGLLSPHIVDGEHSDIYGDHTTFDVDEALRRSEIEAAHYELKQGLLKLDGSGQVDDNMLPKLVRTICAISNNGKARSGSVFLGVADKEADAIRAKSIYGVEPHLVGRRWVVGIKRESDALGISVEDYVGRIRDAIRSSGLSEPLKGAVLASLTYSDYFGLGVVILRVPPQGDVSNVDGEVYVREGDQTIRVEGLSLLDVAKRF
jgi:hypothetical protein